MTRYDGAVVWAADYKPFGEAEIYQIDPNVPQITNNLRFPGQYFDAETGLNYNYFRDYNPAIGRYIQADLIGLWGGINLYAYVGNDSVNWSDLLGLSRDKYLPDKHKHGEPHVDRYTPEGQNVGRYRPDGSPIEHKGKCPPPIPKKDLTKFKKAAKKLGTIGLVVTIFTLATDIVESSAQEAIGNAMGDAADNLVNPFFGASDAW